MAEDHTTEHATMDGKVVVITNGKVVETRDMTEREMYNHLRHLDRISPPDRRGFDYV